MRNFIMAAGAALFVAACAGGAIPSIMLESEPALTAAGPHILAALADARRPEADTARDALRHPADILAFTGVRAGWRVVWTTRVFRILGIRDQGGARIELICEEEIR